MAKSADYENRCEHNLAKIVEVKIIESTIWQISGELENNGAQFGINQLILKANKSIIWQKSK